MESRVVGFCNSYQDISVLADGPVGMGFDEFSDRGPRICSFDCHVAIAGDSSLLHPQVVAKYESSCNRRAVKDNEATLIIC